MYRPKISAFVITYNRADVLLACLKRVSWVDELLVIDKSSSDDGETRRVATECQAKYVTVPWSPLGEETRPLAQALLSGDWVIGLDDDEIFSHGAEKVIRKAVAESSAPDIFNIITHDFILGKYDPKVGDSLKPVLYRRGCVKYIPLPLSMPKIYGTTKVLPDVYIDHLSCRDVNSWIDKVNRYTELMASVDFSVNFVKVFSDEEIERFSNIVKKIPKTATYAEVVTALRIIYYIVLNIKLYEKLVIPGGDVVFKRMIETIVKGDQEMADE